MSWLLPIVSALFAAGGLFISTEQRVSNAYSAYPPQGQIITVEGIRTHVLIEGEGAPVLLLHGIGGSIYAFTSIIDSLRQNYKVIAIDRPGHGYSERPPEMSGDPRAQAAWVHEILEELEIKKPMVVGQSWGGSVAAAYALQYPEDTRGIVFLAPYLLPGHQIFKPSYDLAEIRPWSDLLLYTLAVPASEHIRRIFTELMFYPDPIPPGWLGDTLILSQTPEQIRSQAQDMRSVGDAMQAMAPHYGDIEVPVTIVLGMEDQIVDQVRNAKMARMYDWELIALPQTGHAVSYVEPDTVLAVIRTAMGQTAKNR